MKTNRQIDSLLLSHFDNHKQALILLGARQVGKTTLLKRLFPDALYLLVDEQPIRESLENYSLSAYKPLIGNAKQIILDELHLISDPGRAVKLLYDQVEGIQIIVTGSSALHIKNKTGESMAGRSILYHLHPLTFSEYLVQTDSTKTFDTNILDNILTQNDDVTTKRFHQQALLENALLHGAYPETLNTSRDQVYLNNLAETAVFKDIIDLNLIDNQTKAEELLKLLAYQTGNLISYSEIGRSLGLNTKTVQRYIDIFEQSFLLYRLYPYSRNKRSEIGKSPKIYFWDLGLRNALISNFNPLRIRPDAGALFENFIINETKKLIDYQQRDEAVNYWRIKSGNEVDMVLSNARELLGCEIKLTKGSVTSAFTNRYPEAKKHVITAKNFY